MFKKMTAKECFEKRHSITYEDKIKYCKDKALYQMDYEVDLDNPKTLNEKIIWLALNNTSEDIKRASDKILAKDIISKKIGSEYVVPLIGTYDSAKEFEAAFDSLPKSFVVKSNCGWAAKTVKVVKDKESLDLEGLEDWLKPWNNYYYNNSCVGSEDIVPRLLVEEYLGDSITDYKLFVMNGKAQFFYVVDDRLKDSETKTFLDLDFNILPCHRYDVPSAKSVEKPPCVKDMIRLGEALADQPLVRVDFYYVAGRLYVGELTYTPGMFLSIEPREWDLRLGKLLHIQTKPEV